jgi:WD40 repeat protein
VASHTTLPLAVTAHESNHVKFIDINSGKIASSIVAHPDAVSCVAVDPSGLYVASGGACLAASVGVAWLCDADWVAQDTTARCDSGTLDGAPSCRRCRCVRQTLLGGASEWSADGTGGGGRDITASSTRACWPWRIIRPRPWWHRAVPTP